MGVIVQLFWGFFKIGLFTFGGGYAMIPLIESEIVNKHNWLSLEQFADLVAIAEMTPGPIAVNTATYVGYKVAKFWGALAGTLGVVLPSFLIIWIIASVFFSFQTNPIAQAAFKGLRPAILGMVVIAAISMSRVCIIDYRSIIVFALVVLGVWIFKVHPIIALAASAIIGIVFLR